MCEILEETFDGRISALAEYLLLEKDEIQDIEMHSEIFYSYLGNDYYVMTEEEADDTVDSYIDDVTWEVNNSLENLPFPQYVKVDTEAICNDYNYDSISEKWDMVNDYYIFVL